MAARMSSAFIDLPGREDYASAPVIMTGASFEGLEAAHFQRLTHVHIA
jgi:hypothetical protein